MSDGALALWEWRQWGPPCEVHGGPCYMELVPVAVQQDLFDPEIDIPSGLPAVGSCGRVDRSDSVSGLVEGEEAFPF